MITWFAMDIRHTLSADTTKIVVTDRLVEEARVIPYMADSPFKLFENPAVPK